jgi:hypothetical protein
MATDHDLAARAFDPLTLGSVTPRGWLRRQLRVQADGLSGSLDEFWPSLADNQWLGGSEDGWERGPYYADGLVPLAVLLDDEALRAKARTWVEGFLDWRAEDGWIGPREPAFSAFPDDTWPRAVVLKALRQHYEVTGDERIVEAMRSFFELLHGGELDEHPLSEWARFRWQDLALSVHWLYEHTGEAWLLELSATLEEQGYDWTGHFAGGRRDYDFDYPAPAEEVRHETHVVNNAMGVKAPAVAARRTGEAGQRAAPGRGLDVLDTYHGQVTGAFTGDEHLAGRDPARGTELCAVVELMYSLEELVATLGEVRFADRLERVAYNALPATFTADGWAHQYVEQANQVVCAVDDYPWTNAPDANCFGLEPNYGCCTANFHQGWPKLASHAWMHTGTDAGADGGGGEGLAAVVYAPSTVSTRLDGTAVTVVEETAYPFGDDVVLTVEPEEPATFPLELRIPGWCPEATVERPDGSEQSPPAGEFHAVEREWHAGDEVCLDLSAPVEAERRHRGSVALRRGPLVFALPVAHETRRFPGEDDEPYAHREFYPVEAWNYGLDVDVEDPPAATLQGPAQAGSPFAPDAPPATLPVEGARVPEWELEGSLAGQIPHSPVPGGEHEELTLVPYGSTLLRVSEFPLLE